MRKVTAKEIERLYEFTRQHYVEYYDIQTELVDHLATGIEERWTEHPKMDFEENLNLEFKKFGIHGFADVVEGRINAGEKRYRKLIWKETKDFAMQPKILLLLILSFVALSFLLTLPWSSLILPIAALGLVIFFAIRTFRLRKRMKISGNKYLLEERLVAGMSYNSLMFTLPMSLVWIIKNPAQFNSLFAFAVPMSLIMIFAIFNSYVRLYVIPKRKEEILKAYYPGRLT